MENNTKNIFFNHIDEIILSSLIHQLVNLADETASKQIVCAVKNGDELPHDLLCQLQTLAENIDDLEGSISAKHIICAHATWHSSFVEPMYFKDLPELLKSANSAMRQCILWAFASTISCSSILTRMIIECLYEYLNDSILQWSILFIFRKLSENDDYIEMITDDRWMFIASLSNDLELKEEARITVVHTMIHIYRKRKLIANYIKSQLEELVTSESVSKKLLLVAIQALYKIVVDGARVNSTTLDKLYELVASSDDSIIECVHELLEFLDDKRILSKIVLHGLNSDIKRELVATQNISVSHSKDNIIVPTTELVRLDHLLDGIGHFDRTHHVEIQPIIQIDTDDNQAWHRRTISEIKNLASLAKQGSLTAKDFDYLVEKMNAGVHWLSITRRTTMYNLIATAFLDAAKAGQTLPENVIDIMIDRLTDKTNDLNSICAESLLVIVSRNELFRAKHIKKIEQILKATDNDSLGEPIKEKLIEIYALYIKNDHYPTLDLESIKDDLFMEKTSDKVSFLFLKAATVRKQVFSIEHMMLLSTMGESDTYSLATRQNCLGALYSSIEHMNEKHLLKPELIDSLGEILKDKNEKIQKLAAATLCLIATDEKSRLSNNILEKLAVMLQCDDQKLLHNLLCIYMRLAIAKEHVSNEILDNVIYVLFKLEVDFTARHQAILILKYVVDNGQDLSSTILDAIEACLNDSDSHIRNTAGITFIKYWQQQVEKCPNNDIKLDNLVIFFRNQFDLQVQIQALEFLQYLIEKHYELSDALLELIECCLCDHEPTIVKHALTILTLNMKQKPLLTRTIACLEHLLTTETKAFREVVKILKTVVVCQGHILSERTITHLSYLLFEKDDLYYIVILLQLVDRNQPLPNNIVDFLRQQYYTNVFRYSNYPVSKERATTELLSMTANGQQLSKSVLKTIFYLLPSTERRSSLLPIIVNIINNGQRLSHDQIDSLSKIRLNTEDESLINLMKIFTQLSCQNYLIPENVINYLQKFINKPSISIYVIEIYQHLIEQQKSVDQTIIKEILRLLDSNVFITIEPDLQNRLLTCSKVIANRWPDEINQTDILLLLHIYSSSSMISKNICTIIEALVKNGRILIPSVVETLIYLLNNSDDSDIQSIIAKIFEYTQSNKQIIDDSLLQNMDDDNMFVQDLKKAIQLGRTLTDKDFIRLSHLFYINDVNLKREVANIIAHQRILSDQICNAIFATLHDETINIITIPLLFESSVKLPLSAIDDLLHVACNSTHVIVRETTRKLLNVYMEYSKVQKFLQYEQDLQLLDRKDSMATILWSSNQVNVSLALKILQGIVVFDQQISSDLLLAVAWLLSIHKDLVSNILIEVLKRDIKVNYDVYEAIENVFLVYQSNQMFKLIYMLAQKKIILQWETLKILSDNSMISESVVALEYAARNQLLPTEVLSCLINQLSQESIERTFSILRYQMLQGNVEHFMDYLKKLKVPSIINYENLSQLETFDQYMGTMHTLLFINYFDSTVFEMPAEQWSRECLCVDLLTGCSNNTPEQIVSFYHYLTQLEQYKQYDLYDDDRDLILQELIRKQRTYLMNLSEINQLLIYLQTLTDRSFEILQSDDVNWFDSLRRFFIKDKLEECLCNVMYPQSLINHLVDRITKQEALSADLIEPFLKNVRQPQHVITNLDMITKYHITNIELIQLFANVSKDTIDFTSFVHQMELIVLNRALIRLWHGPQEQLTLAHVYLCRLLELGWMFEKLIELLNHIRIEIDSCDSLYRFIDSLKIIYDYRMKDNIVHRLNKIYSSEDAHSWPLLVHICVVENCFGSTNLEQTISTILEEIKHLNKIQFSTPFIEILQRINQAFESDSSICKQQDSIKNWSISNIKTWASYSVSHGQTDSMEREYLPEILAVIRRAIYLHVNFEVREIQLLAILIILNRNSDGGRLLQILTGEGKSTIVSILTVIKSLQGKHVDIITSSMTLAKRDVNEWKPFYQMFKLTAAHNNDETNYVEGLKSCYKENIVYGTAGQFQFDILRDEFSLLKTRGDRPYDLVIIDEVDSMLIDENNTIARLADNSPGMEWLNPLLYGIWQTANNTPDPLSNRDLILKITRKLINSSDAQLKYPVHLNRFVSDSLPIWVDHAIQAKVEYRLDYQYIIKKDEMGTLRIMPIDYSNTGIIQCHTTWSDGLHQFLQIKHGLKMTPLTITTNYLSNYDLFIRYKSEIYGFSGTLGSTDAQNLLTKIYQVDTIIIPSCKPKRHYQLETILTLTDDAWLNTIVQNTIDQVNKHRAVLVICETRLDAKAIFKELQCQQPTSSIRLYTDNTDNTESSVVSKRIESGDILVATNLAGRGTDLKTTQDVEKHGGLHVCLTFLPKNLRVEEQAFGRTSRQGNCGTSQLILNRERTFLQLMSWYPDYWTDHCNRFTSLIDIDIKTIHDWRTQSESAQLNYIWKKDICELKEKSELFRNFCELLAELKKIKDDLYCLSSVKERWGLWLKLIDQSAQARQAFERTIKEAGFRYVGELLGNESLFFVIYHQLQELMSVDTIGKKIREHISNNKIVYKNNEEEQQYCAVSRALDINIVLFRSDYLNPCIYKTKNAKSTCYIGYIVSQTYLTLEPLHPQSDDKFDNIEHLPSIDNNETDSILSPEELDRVEKLKDSIWIKPNTLYIIDSFESFKTQICKDYKSDKVIQNPYYLILKADNLITKYCSFIHKIKTIPNAIPFIKRHDRIIDQATILLERAIDLEPIFTFTASVNLAYFIIIKSQRSKTYKLKAKFFLTQAQEQIDQYILPSLVFMTIQLPIENDEIIHEDFLKQIETKIDIIDSYNKCNKEAIQRIENSQKLIDASANYNGKIKTAQKLYGNEPKDFVNKNDGEIKLSFHDLTVSHDIVTNDQALELLDLVPKDYSHVSIEFFNMNKKKMETLITKISSRGDCQNDQIDLNLITSTEQYLQVIKLFSGFVSMNLESTQETLLFTEAEAYLTKQPELVKSISLLLIDSRTLTRIMNDVEPANFSIIFNQINLETINQITKYLPDDKLFSCYFENLSQTKARYLLEGNTERNFILHFHKLTSKQARTILNEFNRNEQDISASFNPIVESYSQINRSIVELHEYATMGITRLLLIKELQPRPLKTISIIVALGVAQIVTGACLTALTSGLGATIGMSLIGEGVRDLTTAVKGIYSRKLSLKEYGIQKSLSLAICFASMGFSTIIHAAIVAKSSADNISSFFGHTMKETIHAIHSNAATVGATSISKTLETSLVLGNKQITKLGIKAGTHAVEFLLPKILSQLRSCIQEKMTENINEQIDNDAFVCMLNQALFVDMYYEKDRYQHGIELMVISVLKDHEKICRNNKIIQNVIRAISSEVIKRTTEALQALIKISNGSDANLFSMIKAFGSVIDEIQNCYHFNKKIKQLLVKFHEQCTEFISTIPTFEELLCHRSKNLISKTTAAEIYQILLQHNIVNNNYSIGVPSKVIANIEHIDENQKEHVLFLVGKLKAVNQSCWKKSRFRQKIIDRFVNYVATDLYDEIIQPLTQQTINGAADALLRQLRNECDQKDKLMKYSKISKGEKIDHDDQNCNSVNRIGILAALNKQPISIIQYQIENNLIEHIQIKCEIFVLTNQRYRERIRSILNNNYICRNVISRENQLLVDHFYFSYEKYEEFKETMKNLANQRTNQLVMINGWLSSNSLYLDLEIWTFALFYPQIRLLERTGFKLNSKEIIVTDPYDELQLLFPLSTSKNDHLQTIAAAATSSILGNILFKICRLLNNSIA
ncbi:unnamed protein product [Adineta steineri]|uniref:Protein translocase subunit SecA n=1 Tax=Adineta steineri TaxID=433720 RepID=A0A818V4U9_9BILA|nr:unnamed protein product [Adineta steineri]